MTTTQIDLVRHGHHAVLGTILCGRMPGIGLDREGRDQMAGCAEALGPPIDVIHSSPQRRAVESAILIASLQKSGLEVVAAIDEIDFGDWTGKSFAELDRDPRWHAWNGQRSRAVPPNGEGISTLRARMLDHLEYLAQSMQGARIVLVSHAEPIRVVIMHYLNVPTDAFASIAIEPASINTVLLDPRKAAAVPRVNGKRLS